MIVQKFYCDLCGAEVDGLPSDLEQGGIEKVIRGSRTAFKYYVLKERYLFPLEGYEDKNIGICPTCNKAIKDCIEGLKI